MKKFFAILCVALVGLCASAQSKGDMGLGLNLGAAPFIEEGADVTNFGIGLKFQYNVTNPIRLEANANYWIKSDYISVFDFAVNGHYIFNVSEKFNVYPLVGIGYGSVTASIFGFSNSEGRFLINVGAGAEYAFTNKIAAGVEVKYQYMADFNRIPINIGLTYRF